jgi:hypothetical protein
MRNFSLKQVAFFLFVGILISSSLTALVVSQSALRNLFLEDFPTQYNWTIRTDGSNVWATENDGEVASSSTNASALFGAVFALVNATANTIYVCDGTYTFDHSVTMKSYTYLRGTWASILKASASLTGPILLSENNADWIRIDGLYFDGNEQTPNAGGVAFLNDGYSHDNEVFNCWFYNFKKTALFVQTGDTYRIEHNTFNTNKGETLYSGIEAVNGVVTFAGTTYLWYINNDIAGATNLCAIFDGVTQAVIEANNFEGSSSSASCGVYAYTGYIQKWSNNYLRNNQHDGLYAYGIYLCTFTGNQIEHNGVAGSGGRYGFKLDTVTYSTFTANYFGDKESSPTQVAGLVEVSGCDYNTYVANVFRGNTVAGLGTETSFGIHNKNSSNIGYP